MSFASSAIDRCLSNIMCLFLDKCADIGRRVLPQQCLLCAASSEGSAICPSCSERLPWLPTSCCRQCALPMLKSGLCGACVSHPPRFDRVTAAFAYRWPIAPLIHQYKYAGNLVLAQFLGQALAAKVPGPCDALIPMPLAPHRLRERGFNQALEIARVMSRLTGIPLAAGACRRVRDSAPQAALPWQERRKNIRGAFVCDADLGGLRVAVIDDVLTTGATLDELARNLRRAGAVLIEGWVVARA